MSLFNGLTKVSFVLFIPACQFTLNFPVCSEGQNEVERRMRMVSLVGDPSMEILI